VNILQLKNSPKHASQDTRKAHKQHTQNPKGSILQMMAWMMN